MDPDSFPLILLATLLVAVATVVGATTAHSAYEQSLVAEAVKAGVPPLSARCAIIGEPAVTCAVLGSR